MSDPNGLGGLIRLLMYLLRHDTSDSLTKDKDGYVKLDDLVNHPNIKQKDTVIEDITKIIEQNKEKGIRMFEVKGSGDTAKIKAFGKDDPISRSTKRGSRKKASRKKASRKKGPRKKASRKKASRKKASRKKASRKSGSRKKRSKTSRKPSKKRSRKRSDDSDVNRQNLLHLNLYG